MNTLQMLFTQLAEEASELSVAANKVVRFGPESTYHGESNIQRVIEEIIDILGVVEYIENNETFPFMPCQNLIDQGIVNKEAKIKKYLKVSTELGCLKSN
jgi:hypothetical protein